MHPAKLAVQRINEEAEELRQVAGQRLLFTQVDPVAEAIQHCAQRLAELAQKIEAETAYLSVTQYAALHGVRAATVRRWIRHGELLATQTLGGDYIVSSTAVRRKRLRKVA
jgi:excisionase family DNA binding protein